MAKTANKQVRDPMRPTMQNFDVKQALSQVVTKPEIISGMSHQKTKPVALDVKTAPPLPRGELRKQGYIK